MASCFARKVCDNDCSKLGSIMCLGCEKFFCNDHLQQHRQGLKMEMYTLTEQHNELQQDLSKDEKPLEELLSRIDGWEKNTIKRIQQQAENVRLDLRKHFEQTKGRLIENLKYLSKEFEKEETSDEFIEFELKKWSNTLKKLRRDFESLSSVTIKYEDETNGDSIKFIKAKYFELNAPHRLVTYQSKWFKNGFPVAGSELNQLEMPFGLDIDDDQTLVVTDFNDHRLMSCTVGAKHSETIIAGTDYLNQPLSILIDRIHGDFIVSEKGNRRVMRWSLKQNKPNGEVILPTNLSAGLAMDDEGFLYASDFEKHEVRRYREDDREGVVVAGGNGEGNALNQLDGPRYILVDRDHCLYIADSNNDRIMKWPKDAKEGIIIAGGHGRGNSLAQLNYPNGLLIDASGSIYVADQRNNRVMRWLPEAKEGQILMASLNRPSNLVFDQKGNLYVTEFYNHGIRRFDIR